MLNTMWAVVLPGAIGVTNLIIARTFFQTTIPEELHEAAALDGSSEWRYFFQIVLPLSKALIMLLVVTHAVAYWNSFFDALIYLNEDTKYPLQLVLRNILIQSDVSGSGVSATGMDSYAESQRIAELMKYGMIVVSTFPLFCKLPSRMGRDRVPIRISGTNPVLRTKRGIRYAYQDVADGVWCISIPIVSVFRLPRGCFI